MAFQWCRLWNEMPTDIVWRLIAKQANARLGDVIAAATFLMADANANENERGRARASAHELACALDVEFEVAENILKAFQNRVLDSESRWRNWGKRQPFNDSNSYRAKSYRTRKKSERTRAHTSAHERSPSVSGSLLEEGNTIEVEIENTGISGEENKPKQVKAQKKRGKPKQWADPETVAYPPEMDRPDVRSAAARWIAYKRRRGEQFLPESLESALRLYAPPERFIAAVDQVIAAGWQGLQYAKPNGSQSPPTDPHEGQGRALTKEEARYYEVGDTAADVIRKINEAKARKTYPNG